MMIRRPATALITDHPHGVPVHGAAAEVGLYDYGARWYDSVSAHFVQADTIVPAPGNPMAWDRYAYVLNNPVRYTDPSGHYFCEGAYEGKHNTYHTYTGDQLLDEVFSDHNVKLTGSGWTSSRKYAAAWAVSAEGRYLSDLGDGDMDSSGAKAFKDFYYDGMELEWDEQCPGCRPAGCGNDYTGDCDPSGAVTQSYKHIIFATISTNVISARNNVVHEFGHAFAQVTANRDPKNHAYAKTALALANGKLPGRPNTGDYYGFASAGSPWQQAYTNVSSPNEIFADQHLGAVFDMWDYETGGDIRSNWMEINMAEYVP